MRRSTAALMRRTVLAGAAAVPVSTLIARRGSAAAFSHECATGRDPGHSGDGSRVLGNRRARDRLPPDLRAIAERELTASGRQEREDVARLDDSLRRTLAAGGMALHDVDRGASRDALKAARYHTDPQLTFGDEAWAVLEGTAGRLA